MARRAVEHQQGDSHEDAIAFYRERLSEPAVRPWDGTSVEPVVLGPSWQVGSDGQWVLPDLTIGWDVLGWCSSWLRINGAPWVFTLEQARFVLWWFACDEHGRFLHRDGMYMRVKGAGKDPLGATLCLTELLGPCRVADVVDDQPIAADNGDAWVQTAAVSQEQTKNTMRLMPGMVSDECRRKFRVQIGKETIYADGDRRFMQAVTSSPHSLEGGRVSFNLRNETHLWLANNSGHEMAAVIERNATKSADGAARALSITNAYNPADDSVAQHHREAWELAQDGGAVDTGLLVDSLEAPPDASLNDLDRLDDVVNAVRGDATWLVTERIRQSILDVQNPPSRSRRFWFNQIVAAEDAWIDAAAFDACAAPNVHVADGDEVVLFFDGSKSDDATGLVACRLSDGHVVTVGMWQRPPGRRGDGWLAPRADIGMAVAAAFDRFKVAAFWADPSHTLDDVTQERYWDGLIDDWHRRWCNDLRLWADGRTHSIMWDMTSPKRTAEFTAAAERCQSDIERSLELVDAAPLLTHDGDSRLRRHTHNAKRFPNKFGVSLWKGHRESSRKIDLAVCMVGARMVRRQVLNMKPERQRSGRVW